MPPHPLEELLGFDARACLPSQLKRLRDYSSQHRILLKPDVKLVCSTGDLSWPSIFDDVEPDSPPEFPRSETKASSFPEWIGPNFPLWAVLREMEVYIKSRSIQAAVPFWKVAITEVVEGENANQREAGTCWPALKTTEPSSIQECWVFLGYDVADRSLLSGLSNCGYTALEFPQFIESFGHNLNDYHLFESLEMALKFKERSNVRVKEHAPFYVYGLWRIPQ